MNKPIYFLICWLLASAFGEFQADVRWTCSSDSISIFLRTTKPFEGLIKTQHAKDNNKCQTVGIGTNVAVLKLDLNSDDCGVQYDTESNSYWVDIDVHSHPILIVEGDKTMKITCQLDGGSNASSNIVENEYEMRLLSSRLPVNVVKYSQPYTLQVRPTTSQIPNYFIGECVARGANQTVQLTDTIGCALFKSIMSDFARRDYVEEAEIPSMFRFAAAAKQLRITCAVIECDGKHCGERMCQSESVRLLEKTAASLESQESRKVTLVVDIQQEQVEEISATTATTTSQEELTTTALPSLILADDPVPVPKDLPAYTSCIAEYDFKVIYYLCIFLAVCSIIGFTVNIILCVMLKRRNAKTTSERSPPDILPIPKSATNHPDFWIIENSKQPEMFEATYASVRNSAPSEYGLPLSSDSGSNEIYRRPHLIAPEVRHSNSTFMTHSTTMETDVDSQTSTSYH